MRRRRLTGRPPETHGGRRTRATRHTSTTTWRLPTLGRVGPGVVPCRWGGPDRDLARGTELSGFGRPPGRDHHLMGGLTVGPYRVRIDNLLSMFLRPDFECLQQLANLILDRLIMRAIVARRTVPQGPLELNRFAVVTSQLLGEPASTSCSRLALPVACPNHLSCPGIQSTC